MLGHLRIARPVVDLDDSALMYARGLGLRVLGRFEDHAGFDGVMLGHPDLAFHFEFTRCRHVTLAPSPTHEDLVVIYLPDRDEWAATCTRMLDAGFRWVRSFNPFWERRGRTFADPDGYRVVLENAAWPEARTHA